MNAEFAKWLKAAVEQALPGQAGAVRRSTAILTGITWRAASSSPTREVRRAGERASAILDGRYPHMPGDIVDVNDNGKIDPMELGAPIVDHPWICGAFPRVCDRQGQGRRQARLRRRMERRTFSKPDIVYSDRMTLKSRREDRRPRSSPARITRTMAPPCCSVTSACSSRWTFRRTCSRAEHDARTAERLRAVRRAPALGLDPLLSQARRAGF